MKRAPIILTATVAGLAATLGFNAHLPTVATPAVAVSTASSSSKTASSTSSSASSTTKTVTSAAVPNQYGNVQLKVKISAGKITSIEAVQLPNGDPKSSSINAYAGPLLRQSALSKQSANIDVVSGATYTSDGYKTALQSALDKAGFSSAGGSATSS
jgi:uncharacterized protein with FMN-binding domain